jgi:hypothetical protein
MVQRAARLETYRTWQAELAGEFLKQLAAVQNALEELRLDPRDNARRTQIKETKASGLIEDLNVLALRVELVFRQTMWGDKRGPPTEAKEVVKQAKAALAKPLADSNHDVLDKASAEFVRLASNEIRGRWFYKRRRLRKRS